MLLRTKVSRSAESNDIYNHLKHQLAITTNRQALGKHFGSSRTRYLVSVSINMHLSSEVI